jgi:DNA-binding CsgD family transcriptional regulator
MARTPGAGTAEPARDASAFVDSVGINVHFAYDDGPYGKRARIESLVRTLGVRHVRDGLTAGRNDVCAEDRRLALQGIRFTYITQARPQRAGLQSWASCVGDALEAFEGLNEYDISHPSDDTAWAQTVRTSQAALYRAVKGTPELAHLTVIGPSLTSADAARDAFSIAQVRREQTMAEARRRYDLTNREVELLERILRGEQSAEIARTLSISLATVEWHTKRLLLKTLSQNRTQMAARVLGWVADTE